jgi:hypothetical protein
MAYIAYAACSPAPSKICLYELSSLLQKFFTSSSLTDGSNASTTKQPSASCCNRIESSVSFPVPKLQSTNPCVYLKKYEVTHAE